MKRRTDYQTIACTVLLSAALTVPLAGQAVSETAAPAAPPPAEEEEELIVLSPFEVSASETEGYRAATTLAGNRLNTELRDIGSAVTVVTAEFLRDTGALNNETLLQYTTGTEVGNVMGNFAGVGDGAVPDESSNFTNPNQNTRVRGLTNADNTRDYFLSDIPWDAYNVDRVDMQRGPNSILFGMGSPAGLINSSTKPAAFVNSGEFEVRFDNFGTARFSLDFNRELIEDELAVRLALVRDNQKFNQKPAYSLSERGYGALRWEPGFLKKGSARTIFKANFESGKVESNRPRSLPPNDMLTPWFRTGTYTGSYRSGGSIAGLGLDQTPVAAGDPRVYNNLNRATYNPHEAQNDNVLRPNFGLGRPAINGGPYAGYINPNYNPWIGNYGQLFGGPVAYFSGDGNSSPSYWVQEIRESYGINTSGEIDSSLGFDFHRMIGVTNYSSFARNAGLEYGELGVYKDYALTDASVFDFYNNLIDGPNKEEWQNFKSFNISLAQTFFNDKMGLEFVYNSEDYDNGQLSLLSGYKQGLFIDINAVYADGTNQGTGTPPTNRPYQDGTPNPNVGRPFLTDSGQFGNNSRDVERRGKRATGFITHDFEREGQSSNLLTRILGSHTLTGMWAEDDVAVETRSWQRYAALDPSYRAFLNIPDTTAFTDNAFAPNIAIYLGDSLIGSSTASGANIPRPTTVYRNMTSTVRVFDSHWANLPGVDPAAEWLNETYLAPEYEYPDFDPENPDATDTDGNLLWPDRRISTQSENPANYVGWTNIPLVITDSEAAPGNRDLLTSSVRRTRSLTTSKAFVWQAKFLDNSIVGTYGWRNDRAQGWQRQINTNSTVNNENGVQQVGQYKHLILTPETLALPTDGSDLDGDSTSWSIVAHFNQLPLVGSFVDKLPIAVSAYYNDSENFQPEALRVDVYGEQIALPSGHTEDYGILLQTKDGKYSLKINKYTTEATNANSNGLDGAWFLGSSQAWGGNWANRFEYDIADSGQPIIIDYQANNRPAGAVNPPGYSETFRPGNVEFDATNSLYNYGTAPGETLEQALARENTAVAAWRAWQAQVDPRFYAAWGIDLTAPYRASNRQEIGASTPNGFSLTEDSISKGYEVEFTAQATRNWRIAINAAKTKATRTNIGGANLADFINGYQNALLNTAAGDLRVWWGGSGNETTLYQWNVNVGSEWAVRALQEGTNVPELREWRVNAISNYDFSEGRLKGFNVGGGVRYQSSVVIGYPVVAPAGAVQASFDIDNPYEGPSEMDFDFWVGYGRRISDKVDWRVQLNVRNAFTGNELIPITAQPDGTPAAYRIAPPRTITLTNTFKF